MTLALRLCHSSAQSACSAGLVHFTMQLKPCGRRTRTKFPTFSNSSSSENGVLLGMLAKWHQLFWTFVLARPKQFFTPPVKGRAMASCPACPAAKKRPQTAGRPGADQGTLPKRQEFPDVRVRLPWFPTTEKSWFFQNHSVECFILAIFLGHHLVPCFLPELDSSKDLILEKIRENVPSQTNFGHISTVSKVTNPGKPEVLNIDSKGLRDFCSIFGSPRISGKDLKISQRFLIYNIYTCTDHWKSHAGENKPISFPLQELGIASTCITGKNSGSMVETPRLKASNSKSFGRTHHKKSSIHARSTQFARSISVTPTRLNGILPCFMQFVRDFMKSTKFSQQTYLTTKDTPLTCQLLHVLKFAKSHLSEPFCCGLCHERHLQSGHCRVAAIRGNCEAAGQIWPASKIEINR